MSAIVSSLESSCAPRTSTLNKNNRHSRTKTSERTPMMVIVSLQRTGTRVRSGSQRAWPLRKSKAGILGHQLSEPFSEPYRSDRQLELRKHRESICNRSHSQSNIVAIAPRGVSGKYRARRQDYKPRTSRVYQCGTSESGPDAVRKDLFDRLSHLLHQ